MIRVNKLLHLLHMCKNKLLFKKITRYLGKYISFNIKPQFLRSDILSLISANRMSSLSVEKKKRFSIICHYLFIVYIYHTRWSVLPHRWTSVVSDPVGDPLKTDGGERERERRLNDEVGNRRHRETVQWPSSSLRVAPYSKGHQLLVLFLTSSAVKADKGVARAHARTLVHQDGERPPAKTDSHLKRSTTVASGGKAERSEDKLSRRIKARALLLTKFPRNRFSRFFFFHNLPFFSFCSLVCSFCALVDSRARKQSK